jgi:hypothetical protein
MRDFVRVDEQPPGFPVFDVQLRWTRLVPLKDKRTRAAQKSAMPVQPEHFTTNVSD